MIVGNIGAQGAVERLQRTVIATPSTPARGFAVSQRAAKC
jgi:hypothetical protein